MVMCNLRLSNSYVGLCNLSFDNSFPVVDAEDVLRGGHCVR